MGSVNQGVFGEADIAELEKVLKDYPTTSGWEARGARVGTVYTEQVVVFPGEQGRLRPLVQIGDRLDQRSEYMDFGHYAVRPRLGTGYGRPPSRLLTLWALLFALSHLARYHSDRWVALLAPDRSIAAVALEEGLEVALNEAPVLVLDAFTSG
jgi:hypothetical protein